MERFLSEQQLGGSLDSSGTFTVDAARAGELLPLLAIFSAN